MVCRDRAGSYADGARTGAPNAIQVADRFHLWQNLGTAVERSVRRHSNCLKTAASRADGLPNHAVTDHADAEKRCRRSRRVSATGTQPFIVCWPRGTVSVRSPGNCPWAATPSAAPLVPPPPKSS
ncbi:transposase [Streptomyces sp. NPDC056462]|uniref:transposase n=1 Tax=Streptomyces sp. NPDC056462 TaxID=3345826 RepID=UPI00369448BC